MGNLANRFRPASDVTPAKPPAKQQPPSEAKPQQAPTPKTKIKPAEKRNRGRPHSGNETVTLRMSSAVLAKYRASGEGWQARLNADLVRLCGL